MTSAYRDFAIPGKSDIGNIDISLVEDGVFCVTLFGLNYGYRFAFMRVTYPTQFHIYDACKTILDAFTHDFSELTCEGHKDYILIHSEGATEYEYIQHEFTKETIEYLTTYKNDFDFVLSAPYRLLEGRLNNDGKFEYDQDMYLHCEDDFDFQRE